MIRRLLLAVAALLVLVAGAAALYAWRTFPTLDGELKVPGLQAPAWVRRDAADVTHVEAANLQDASFALGYVHAQERGWQLEFNRRVMHGELSAVFGPTTLETDKLMRRLGILQAADAQWKRLPAPWQQVVQAYVDGINAFHATSSQALPPEFHLLRVKPGRWTPQDSMGWALMMALDLGGNWGTEFARLSALQKLSTEQLWQLMPPYPGDAPPTQVDLAALYRGLGVFRSEAAAVPKTVSQADGGLALPDLQAWAEGLGHVEGIGSNNWVVAGSRTATGKPLLANDPHLGLSAPAIWYFARIQAAQTPAGKPMDVIGATLPGLPSVVLGRTAGVAWGFTNTNPDVQDLYLEQLNPANPNQYRTPEGWADFGRREETIRVKGQPDVAFTVLSTRHGPVMSNGNAGYEAVVDTSRYALALRWAALDADNTTVLAGMQANLAQDTDQLLAAYAGHHSPMQNLVLADTRGRTGFHAIGRVPVRSPQHDLKGLAPAPGWEARYDWTGWIPFAENPRLDDAAIQGRGWHATANQRIHGPDYPHYIQSDWATPERQDRIDALLGATRRHTAESMRTVHGDILSAATRRLLPVLKATASTHPQAQAALATLQGFDGEMRADAAAPLVFAVWADEFTRGIVAPKLGEQRFAALYGKRTFRSGLQLMLEDKAAGDAWCAPRSCAEQSSLALGRALDRIVATQGSDAGAWRWGAAHEALSGHRPFGNVAALARFFDVRVATGGDPWTVNVGQYWANDAKNPFANRHAASLRAIYDLADPEKSQFIYQTGQSGLVFSPRYRDMGGEWAAVQYRPLKLRPERWVHESVLKP